MDPVPAARRAIAHVAARSSGGPVDPDLRVTLAHPGGGRWSWESRMFGAAYDDAPAAERPTYGSLNFRRRTAGGSSRFGSSHLRLRPDTPDLG